MKNRPVLTKNALQDYLSSLDDSTAKDTQVLIDMMQRISGQPPTLWNVATLGFDSYHYKYESGREGDCHIIGFHPRKGKLTLYLMDGTARYTELLSQMGKHSTSKACVYIKRLSDVQLPILEKVLRASYDYVKSQDGHMHRAVEKKT